MLAILNESLRQHPRKQQPYGHHKNDPRRTRHARHCWRSKDRFISDILPWTPSYIRAKTGQLARTYNHSSWPIQDIALKTSRERWKIETGGERGSGMMTMILSSLILYFYRHPSVIERYSITSFLSLDDGLLKPKRYNVDFLSYDIRHFGLPCFFNFLHIDRFFSITYFHSYIHIIPSIPTPQ